MTGDGEATAYIHEKWYFAGWQVMVWVRAASGLRMRFNGEGPIYGARGHPRYRAAWKQRVRYWGEAEAFLGNVSVSPSNGGGVR